MAAKKGHPKAGGRQQGTKNKKSLLLENFAQTIVEGGMERFQSELNKLSGKEYVNAFMALFEYTKPKLARTEVKNITPPDRTPHLTIIQDGKEISLKLGEMNCETP